MEQEWLTGGTAAVDGPVIEGLGDLRRAPGARVQAACEGPVGLAVVGDCPVTQEEQRAALPAVRVGQWAELTRWPGSYWVVADNGRQRFVCGDLAGIRAVYYTLRGDEGAAWASQARLLGQDRRLTPRFRRRLAWPRCPWRSRFSGSFWRISSTSGGRNWPSGWPTG